MCMRTYAYLMFMYARAFVCACARSQRPLAVFNTLHLLIADFLIFNFRRYFNNAPIISRAGYLALFSQFYICLLFRLIFNVVFHGDLLLWRTLLY